MKKWQIVLLGLIAVVAVILIVFIGTKHFAPKRAGEEQAEKMKEDYIDAEEYYHSHAEVLIDINAKESKIVQTEAQIAKDIRDRGLEGYPICFEYSMDGEYVGEQEITESNEKHPSYQTSYISSSGSPWTIVVINGCIMANPILYNMESGKGVQLIIAESDKIMCYDGPTNKFYETIPDESVLIVKVVDRIDAATLDRLTTEEINGL